MRLILIILVFLGGLGFCGYKTYRFFVDKKEEGQAAYVKGLEEQGETTDEIPGSDNTALPAPTAQPQPVTAGPVVGKAPIAQTVVGSYRFQNRLVPAAPGFLRDDTKVGMVVQTEEASNSWVWIGGPVLAAQIRDLAISYDVAQVEMDLDFVLVLVNTERLKARGLSIFYQERANWLDALSLTGDSGSLRISSGGLVAELAFSDSTTGLQLLSQPVVRCLDGHPWSFATDSEVPVPRSEVIDGIIRQSIEFRAVGFGLEGVVRIVGKKILLVVDQRNGSVTPASAGSSEVPIFQTQSLRTACELDWLKWSVLGGIQVDREELRKGVLRNSLKATSDYLVIFVRPRLSLDAPPSAVPVHGRKAASDDLHPLLPPDGIEIFDGAVLPSRK